MPDVLVVASSPMVERASAALLRIEPFHLDARACSEAPDSPDEGDPHLLVVVSLASIAEASERVGGCRSRWPEVPIVVIAAVDRARDAAALVRSGAIAVVSVNETTSSMTHAIDAARARRPYTSPSVAALVVEELFSQVEETPPPPHAALLSTRERELLGLICAGKTDREAAAELGISVHTVRSHRQSIMKKLGVRGAAQLVRTAIERRLIER